MANLKISQLTATTQNTIGSWVVINNSGETTSNKSQLEYVLGLTKGSGNSSMKSADFLTEDPSVASSDYSIALGNGASASTAPSIVAIGNGAYSVSENCIVIGKNAHDQGAGRDDGIAIGTDAEIYQPRAISIGKNAGGVTDAITIGTDGRAIANTSIAIGASTVVAGDFGVGIGYDIFQDRTNATVIGTSSYVSGADSTVVGAQSKLGQTGGDSERSTIVGSTNVIEGPEDDSVIVGYNNTIRDGNKQIIIGNDYVSQSEGSIVIGGKISGPTKQPIDSNSHWAVMIGGSGNTFTTELGPGNLKIGGFDDEYHFQAGSRNTWIGGQENDWNPVGGSFGQNNVFLGLSGRSVSSSSGNRTYVENLTVFGSISQGFNSFTNAGTITLNPSSQGYVEIGATGGTYNIQISPAPNDIGDTMTLFIEYTSGATINFVSSGSVDWRWNNNTPPVFSATTVSRSIIVVNTWDGNDMWEVSRSMNMS